MSIPRVFISHGAGGDPDILGLLERIKVALQPKFAVLIDKDDIPLGADWRRTLNTWVGGCHAAILLLSERAIERPWVLYEASILTFRQNCRVITVFLPPVNGEAVRKSLLGAAAIDARQAIGGGSEAETIAGIETALAGLAEYKTPIDTQCEYAEAILDRVTDKLARALTDELQFDLGDWKSDSRRDLALALMSHQDLLAVANTLQKVREFLLNEREFYNLFEIVANSWVDASSAERVDSLARGDRNRRAIAVNALRPLIAESYVKRSCGRPPLRCWKIASIDGVFGDDPMKTLEGKVEAALLDAFHFTNREQLNKKLIANEKIGEPVVLALPGAGLDGTVLQHLRETFPTVTFFALAGDDSSTHKTLQRSGVEVLRPPLDATFEERFQDAYETVQLALDLPVRIYG